MHNRATAFQLLREHMLRPISRDKIDTLLLLAACVLVLLPHFAHLSLPAVISCSMLLVWRGWITFRGNRLPPRWLLLPLSIAAMAIVFTTYRTFLGREPGVMMLVLLLALKLLEMHAKRDVFVVVFLGFFLMLTSFFHSQSIGSAVLTGTALVLLLTAQMSFQYTGVAPPLRYRLALGFRIVGLAVPLTIVAFVLFPRIEGPLWQLPGDAHAGRTGLSDRMTSANIARLALSDEIAFRVKFTDEPPSRDLLYWRGPVLGHYDGQTWTEIAQDVLTYPVISVRPGTAPVRYQVTLEPHGRRWLFALEMPQSAPFIEKNPSLIAPDLQLLATFPIHQRVRYEAASFPEYALQPHQTRSGLRPWLQLPAGYNPRTVAFASQLRSQYQDQPQLVNAVLRFFREQRFRYTLEPPPVGSHPVDDFLFSTRAGFCEHYAGAFVVLMRALGIPARVITGYQGGEINNVDGYMVVRQSDAHAWAEIWLEGSGWIRVDPTAAVSPDRIERNLGEVTRPSLLGGLITLPTDEGSWMGKLRRLQLEWRNNLDAVANIWNQWVLNYTFEKQLNLLRSLGFAAPDWRTLALLMLATGLAVLTGIFLLLAQNRKRIHPVDQMYHALCEHLAQLGYARAIHEGPRAYRNRLISRDSTLPQEKQLAASRFLDLYETIRYGALSTADAGGRHSPDTVSRLRLLLNECK